MSTQSPKWNYGLRPSTLPLVQGGSPQYWVSHVDGEETFCFFQTAETGNRTPNSSVKGSGSNHYPRAPARHSRRKVWTRNQQTIGENSTSEKWWPTVHDVSTTLNQLTCVSWETWSLQKNWTNVQQKYWRLRKPSQTWVTLSAQTDRQTDRYFIDRNKSHYRLICHSNKRDICTCIYKNVSLLKSYITIYIVW